MKITSIRENNVVWCANNSHSSKLILSNLVAGLGTVKDTDYRLRARTFVVGNKGIRSKNGRP